MRYEQQEKAPANTQRKLPVANSTAQQALTKRSAQWKSALSVTSRNCLFNLMRCRLAFCEIGGPGPICGPSKLSLKGAAIGL